MTWLRDVSHTTGTSRFEDAVFRFPLRTSRSLCVIRDRLYFSHYPEAIIPEQVERWFGRFHFQQVAKRDMDDVPSRSDTARVPEDAVSRDNNAGLPDSDATVLAALPVRVIPEPSLADEFPQSNPDATIVGGSANLNRNATETAATGSSAATLIPHSPAPLSPAPYSPAPRSPAPRSPAPRSPSPLAVGGSGGNAILLEIGTILGGRYEIVTLLGEGGMGAVYKARDREVDRVVALKVIRPAMASNPEILARFKQELLLSSQVTHRNVIRIYDLGEAQGIKFITMEYVDGETLHQLLKQRAKLEVAEAVDIMEQVASGLAAAHREGIIHRDLKPANIMLDKNGRVVVMDFGLARTFSGDGMTQIGTMLGTMEYMSPEQAQGMDVKASSDIFTVGLILYELLAGVTPFHAETAIASLLLRTQQRAAPLVNVDRNISGTLSNIVAKCLEKDPARRYQSAEHLDSDLRAWQGGSGAKSIAASAIQQRAQRMRGLPWMRIWMRIGVAGVLVVALAAGGSWYFIARRKAASALARGPVSVLIGDFANHTGDSVLDNTLEPMLGVAMEGASFINVYSRGDARKLAKKLSNTQADTLDEQTSRLVAINQSINAVITGEISRRGDQYDISAIALDTQTGNVLAKADVTVADKQQILTELPKLAIPIRTALGDTTPPSQQFEKVSGGFTASSLEAVHEDALGVEAQFAGRFQEAFDHFQKSAELDPRFARAYSGMGAMSNNLGRPTEAVKYMKLAMANVDRMTERERFRNQGLLYLTTGNWQSCVEQYTQLVTLYPADRVGQNNLAICYLQLRDASNAFAAARHAVEITPKAIGQRLTLAFVAVFASDFTTGEKEARTALEIGPTVAQGHLMLAEAKIGQGQIKEATASYNQLANAGAAGASNAADGLADLAAYQGNYAEAARILVAAAAVNLADKLPDKAARKYAVLADLEELQGHQAAAISYMGKALSYDQGTPIQMLAGMLYAEAGDMSKAQKIAASLGSQTLSEPRAYSNIIQGLIALKQKNTKAAVTQITSANALLNTWIGHFELGRAYLEAGDFKEADLEFELCLKRRGEAIELFDDNVPTYAYFPPTFYYQGLARQGLKSANFAESFRSYTEIRGLSSDDSLAADARQRIRQ